MDTAVVFKDIERPRQAVMAGWITRGLVVGLVVALYAEIMADLASEWWTVSSSSYGMLIPPLAGYIAYMKRNLIFAISARPDLRGLWLTLLGCLLLIGGHLAAEFFLARISIVLLI